MKDLIANQLVKYLEARSVEHIFGLCGHTNIAVLAALEKSSIRFVNTRHGQVAAHAADGYARAKKQTAVVLKHATQSDARWRRIHSELTAPEALKMTHRAKRDC